MKRKQFFYFFILIVVIGCEKNSLNTDNDSINRPVIESFLQPGVAPIVFAKKQIPYLSTDSIELPLIGLNISIENVGTGESHTLTHSDSSAYIGSGWQVVSGQTYRMSFEYNGKTITAETTIPAKPIGFNASVKSIQAFDASVFNPGSGTPPVFPDPIELSWDASDGGYYMVVVEVAQTNPELIFSDTTRFRPFRAFRTQPEQTNTYSLQSMSFRYYGTHRILLYHLNPEYAALYEDSGTNSTNLTTPYTNVEGGLGIFTGINADTIVVQVTK